jgi:hypothetical protein
MNESRTDADRHVALWSAINEYARACGGEPAKRTHGNTARMRAVAEIERLVAGATAAADATTVEYGPSLPTLVRRLEAGQFERRTPARTAKVLEALLSALQEETGAPPTPALCLRAADAIGWLLQLVRDARVSVQRDHQRQARAVTRGRKPAANGTGAASAARRDELAILLRRMEAVVGVGGRSPPRRRSARL